jgi:probable F420-dependent oxidoreductase
VNDLRIGARLSNYGEFSRRGGLSTAKDFERAGFDSLWCADHIVMPSSIESTYPFSPDGRFVSRPDIDWFEVVVTMAMIAAVTQRCEIGSGVLVAPLREPLLLAKQLATLDALAGGRLVLGVGSGWLNEEFDALGIPFESRGERLDESIHVLRKCWTGSVEPFEGAHFRVPRKIFCYPTPVRVPPVLVGGMSRAAVQRAGRIGDGWYALQSPDQIDIGELASAIMSARGAATAASRDPKDLRFIISLSGPGDEQGLAELLPKLREVGFNDVVVDGWGPDRDPVAHLARLRAVLSK